MLYAHKIHFSLTPCFQKSHILNLLAWSDKRSSDCTSKTPFLPLSTGGMKNSIAPHFVFMGQAFCPCSHWIAPYHTSISINFCWSAQPGWNTLPCIEPTPVLRTIHIAREHYFERFHSRELSNGKENLMVSFKLALCIELNLTHQKSGKN